MWHIAWAIHRSSSPHLLLYPGTTPAHVGKLACNRQPREQDMSPPPCYAMLHTRTHGCSGSTKKVGRPMSRGWALSAACHEPSGRPSGCTMECMRTDLRRTCGVAAARICCFKPSLEMSEHDACKGASTAHVFYCCASPCAEYAWNSGFCAGLTRTGRVHRSSAQHPWCAYAQHPWCALVR